MNPMPLIFFLSLQDTTEVDVIDQTENLIIQIGKTGKLFNQASFFRSHRSALINKDFMHAFIKKANTLQLRHNNVELEFTVVREKLKELESLI